VTPRRLLPALPVAPALAAGAASCGGDASEGTGAAAAALPPTGTAYRALGEDARRDVAAACRDRAAARATGDVAASQLADVDPAALRARLDAAYTAIALQRRPVAEVCARELPFVTPGLDVRVHDARSDGDGGWAVDTRSDRPLSIRGRVTGAGQDGDGPAGTVTVRRETGPPLQHTVGVGPDGSFAFTGLPLRKVADNSFTLTFRVGAGAPRKAVFTAICLDCVAGAGTAPAR